MQAAVRAGVALAQVARHLSLSPAAVRKICEEPV